VLIGIGFSVGGKARASAQRAQCLSNLRQIGQAIAMYRQDYQDPLYFLPTNMRSFYPTYISDRRILDCPRDGTDWQGDPFPVSYIWPYAVVGVRHRNFPPEPEESWPQLYARRGNEVAIAACSWHRLPSENTRGLGWPYLVLRLDGHVEIVNKIVHDTTNL